jgi:hypothetical protein
MEHFALDSRIEYALHITQIKNLNWALEFSERITYANVGLRGEAFGTLMMRRTTLYTREAALQLYNRIYGGW